MPAPTIQLASPAQRAIEDRVLEGLRRVAGQFSPSGPGRWQFSAVDQGQACATLAIDGNWLSVERALPGFRLTRVALTRRWGWRALDECVDLPAGVRAVLAAPDMCVRIRAERLLSAQRGDDPQHLGEWIRAAFLAASAFKIGARNVGGTNPGNGAGNRLGNGAGEDAGEGTEVDIPALCEQAGWPVTPRGVTADTVVALPGRDGTRCHAVVLRVADGLRLRVALVPVAGGLASPSCQAAATLALLRTAAHVRLVRASAARTEHGINTALEIRVDPPLDPQLLSHAFAALAVAHQQVTNELTVLASNTALASAYLSVQGVR